MNTYKYSLLNHNSKLNGISYAFTSLNSLNMIMIYC